jgi:N6-adenosine-specific RNA methylase IME4/ParB-like chromosome segregation protein Spo0J
MEIGKLKAHWLNTELYGDSEPDSTILESIRANGILEAIAVTPDGTILSGHRRWRAAIKLEIEDVPTREIVLPSEIDEQAVLLEFNRQREKTFSQKMREAEKLREIVEMKARQKQETQADYGKFGGRPRKETVSIIEGETLGKILPRGFSEPPARDETMRTNAILGAHVGMKRKSFEMAKKVFDNAQSGDERAIELVKKLDSGRTTINAAYNDVRASEQKKAAIERINDKSSEPDGLFEIVASDPPWPYEIRNGDPLHLGRCPYPAMSIDQICALHIPASNDCILFLWTTNSFMHEAFHVLESWRFTHRTILTWVKDHIGLGNWLRGQTEHCLLATRGKPPVTLSGQANVIHAPVREHSRKPEEFYALVDSLCHGRKLDMFSREKREGWHQHGVEPDMF